MANEIIGYIKRIINGIEINQETLAVDLFEKIGPGVGGSFLDEDHTYEYYQRELWTPTISDRGTWESWEKQGKKRYGERLTEKVKEILEIHKPELLPKNVLKKISAIVRK